LDVINKKYVVKESMLAMLFYTALFTVVIASVPAYFVWKALTLHQFVLLFLLGCGANLILYCLLKAFKYADASAIAPFRYVELILSAGFSIVIFKEIPSIALISGILIIVPCTMYFAYIENKHEQEEPELVPETETVIEDAEKTQA